ncbi:MAG TPA: carboxypeptidase regulatory-like domain-containing protein [Blastocatellia bacterium]|nr:carboxypeptidase regulatory-like domain-containing protein [Blastocatellia bacterium]
MNKTVATFLSILLLLTPFGTALGQAQSPAELHGTVTDETGAYMVAVPVTLDDGKGQKYSAVTDDRGRYSFKGIKPGTYTVAVEMEGFAPFAEEIPLTSRQAAPYDITLRVFIADQVEVRNDSAGISTEPDKNLSSVTLDEKDIEALPDDPDDLLDTLRQMAGAGAADDAAIYVGGFRERGRIPPKESIQMIRINVNPYSAEYSEPGSARIEIITKPGTDTFHGGFRLGFFDEALNARDPFAPSRAPLQVRNYNGNFSGPIIRNRWGFFVDIDRQERDENDVVSAIILNPATLTPEPFTASLASPSRRNSMSLRTDILANSKHTLGFQYRYNSRDWSNLNSGFDLPERRFESQSSEHTLRFSLTSIASERSVNEMRLQLTRQVSNLQALSDATAIIVLDSFNAGGNQGSLFNDSRTDSLEFNDLVTYTRNNHTIKAGVRAEAFHIENVDRANFGGTFTFGSDVERDAFGNPVLDASGSQIPITPLERYRRVLRGVPGYRPSQFSINRGDPFVGVTQWELSWFAQDDWKVSDRLTLSYGLRHDFQTQLEDKLNFAPRLGLAWVADKDKKGVVRAAAGVFYSRLDTGVTTSTLRFDGERQQNFVINQPSFFETIPDTFEGTDRRQPTVRIKSDGLNAPYTIMSSVGYERQLPRNTFAAATYTFTRGVHLLRSRNINAPLVSDEGGELIFPFPGEGPILQYESTGLLNRHELRLQGRASLGQRYRLFGSYTLASTRGNADLRNWGLLPANSYDLSTEFGRAGNDVRHEAFIMGTATLPWNVSLNSFINLRSGTPFNITTGRDNNRDTFFNDRPAFADAGDPDAIVTEYGIFNPNPGPGDEIIPRNFGQNPGFVSVNATVSKTWGFGPPRGGFQGQAATRNAQAGQGQNQRGPQDRRGPAGGNFGGGRGGPGGGGFGGRGGMGGFGNETRSRYNLTFSVSMRNIFNQTNFRGFNGVLTSPNFGRANSAFEPRRVEASLRFAF